MSVPLLKFLKFPVLLLFISLLTGCGYVAAQSSGTDKSDQVYEVSRLKKSMKIDGQWDKKQWKKIKPLTMELFMGKVPDFIPKAQAKMMYDNDNVYVIFKVDDQFVRSVVSEYNGNVSGDACVEFFFSPDSSLPERYFNLEVNAGGVPLIFYVTKPWTGFTKLDPETEIKQIEIAHSLPGKIENEITTPVTWTIEYRIPLSLLKKYANVTDPEPGTIWKANFYKTASRTSNPHWMTWNYVDHPKPNFHLPEYFGTLRFR